MVDILSPEERSQNMAAIRSRDTKPEVYLRKLLFAKGYRYRIAEKSIPGHPDIFLRKYNTAIFVHGCFWHRHSGCKYAYTPKSRIEFWQKKFDDNIKRDAVVAKELQKQGVKHLVVWECTIKRMRKAPDFEAQIFSQIEAVIKNSSDNSLYEICNLFKVQDNVKGDVCNVLRNND